MTSRTDKKRIKAVLFRDLVGHLVICGFLMGTHRALRDTTGQAWRGPQRCPVMNRLPSPG